MWKKITLRRKVTMEEQPKPQDPDVIAAEQTETAVQESLEELRIA